MGVAFRDVPVWRSQWATNSVAGSWTGERPLWILRSWDSPPVENHDHRKVITLLNPAQSLWVPAGRVQR